MSFRISDAKVCEKCYISKQTLSFFHRVPHGSVCSATHRRISITIMALILRYHHLVTDSIYSDMSTDWICPKFLNRFNRNILQKKPFPIKKGD